MENEDRIAAIVAKYLRVEPSTLHRDVPIGSSAFSSSVVMYRMFAELAEATGGAGGDPQKIATYGDLLDACSGKLSGSPHAAAPELAPDLSQLSIGIDVEMVANLPSASDYRTDAFYVAHFSEREIAACLASADPVQSFCGRYAAKEAIVKADARRGTSTLRDIEILTDGDGKPQCAGVALSISHTPLLAVAVAIAYHKR